MNKCTLCGYENNDGADYCLNCKARLKQSNTLSDYDVYMNNQKKTELARAKIKRKTIQVAIAIVTVVVVGIGIFIYRYKTAPSRAENLVCNYIQSHVSNVESVIVSATIGSCLDGNYIRNNGFWMNGNVVINGKRMMFTAEVDMDGIFDSGKITSIQINYQEIYKR